MARRLSLAGVAGLAAALALAWAAVDSLRPFVTFEREVVVSTPALGALESRYELRLRPDDVACVRPVTLTGGSQNARIRVLKQDGPPVPPLEVTATAPGYRSTGVIAGYDAPGDQIPRATLDPPDRELRGELCVRNAGQHDVHLLGTDETRSQVVAETTLNDRVLDGKEAELTFLEAGTKPLIERPADLIDHSSTFASGFPEPLLWLLLLLVVLGLPAAAIGGLYLVLRSER